MSLAPTALPTAATLPTAIGYGLTERERTPGTPPATPPGLEVRDAAPGRRVAEAARDRISLSGERPEGGDSGFAAPFAEIWRDGRKLAEIDVRGEVRGVPGLVGSLPGGAGGIALAATRAASLAQALGGEIRSAGEPMDLRTLALKHRVNAAYGA